MIFMKISEIRSMSVPDLLKHMADDKAELAKERAVVAGGTRPEKPGRIRQLRRGIARMLTVINEKEKGIGKHAAAAKAGEKTAKAEKKKIDSGKKLPVKQAKKGRGE